MKRILLFLILIISNLALSQNKNFTVENGLIHWKYVYEDSRSISELRNNPRLEFLTDSTGTIKKTNFEDKRLNQLTGEFRIESKNGKYRASVFNVKFYVEPTGLYSGGISMQTISEFTIEKSLIKKDGTIRESYLGYNLTERLNPHFTDLFLIKDKSKSDW